MIVSPVSYRAVSLQNADNMIKKLIDEVVAMGKKFTAILTASHPSKVKSTASL